METKKISELTEVTNPIATDVFPIVNGGETKKVQLTNIKSTLGINGTVLYDNASGSNVTIDLSDNPLTYDYIDIFYKAHASIDYGLNFTRTLPNLSGYVNLTLNIGGNTWFNSYYGKYQLTSTQFIRHGCWIFGGGNAVVTDIGTSSDRIYITKVIGYKKQ